MDDRVVTFRPGPEGPGLYIGYNVFLDGRKIGFIGLIGVNGHFRNTVNELLTPGEHVVIEEMCDKVRQLPEECGWLAIK